MMRLLLFFIIVTLAAVAMVQLADQPGMVALTWLGYEIETSVFVAILAFSAVFIVALIVWSFLRYLFSRPAELARQMRERKEERGLEALSQGLIAIAAGDRDQARKFASLAQKRLPEEPLTGLLRAQAAQLAGDRDEARAVFEAMAKRPRTELLGLRGLFLEARREEKVVAARQFAERAMERNPDLEWSVTALFELQCSAGDWDGALKTLDVARRQKQIDRETLDRRRAVLLTAQALALEDTNVDRARELALEANKLAPGLVPAAALAGRLLVAQGSTSRAGKILTNAWKRSRHPDLARAYAYLRPGDQPRDRLKRVNTLAAQTPGDPEAAVAVAVAAVEAREWEQAREALAPLLEDRPQARVCSLMARIEGGESGDQGRVREWLARAVRAPRDPAWTADGFTAGQWAPVSPVTGMLDAFQWRVPVEMIGPVEQGEFVSEPAIDSDAPIEISSSDEDDAEPGLRPDPAAPEPAPDAPLLKEDVHAPSVEGQEPTTADGPKPDPAAEARVTPPEKAAGADGPSPAAAESRIFVSPRPPDDPGPEPDPDETEASTEDKIYQSQ